MQDLHGASFTDQKARGSWSPTHILSTDTVRISLRTFCTLLPSMTDDKDYLETCPLAACSDNDDVVYACERHDATRERHKNLRNPYLAAVAVLVTITSICSGLLGAYIGQRIRDLDSTCASHTAQYCEFHVVDRIRSCSLMEVLSTCPQGDKTGLLRSQF